MTTDKKGEEGAIPLQHKTHPLTTGNVTCTQLIFRLRGEEIVSLPLGLWFIGPHSARRGRGYHLYITHYTAPTLFFILSFRLIYSTFYEQAIRPGRTTDHFFSFSPRSLTLSLFLFLDFAWYTCVNWNRFIILEKHVPRKGLINVYLVHKNLFISIERKNLR